jgi:uncharacterized membrane protein YdbT with pleckstrin-like domain
MIVDKTDRPNILKTIFPFTLLNEAEIKKFAYSFEQVNFPAGATIFSDGYPANDLYFILSGSVKVTFHKKNHDEVIGTFSAGDHFGEESLTANKLHQTRAICLSDVSVLRIKGRKARVIGEAFPQIRNVFSLFQKTFHLSCSENLPWRSDAEGIELFSRRHPFFFIIKILVVSGISLVVFSALLFFALASKNSFGLLLGLSCLAALAGFGLCMWSALEWANDFFIITHDRVTVQKKLIGYYESRHESPVSAILSVGIDTSLLGRLLGYGTVTVRTYTGDLRFERLPFPYLIHELLEIRRQDAELQANQAEKREIREALTGSMEPHSSPKTSKSPSTARPYDETYHSGSFSDLLARFFNLRIQTDDSVTYHTHWWILIKKTFLPGLFGIAAFLVILARFVGFFEKVPDVVVYIGGVILIVAAFIWWIYEYQDWQNDIYILTADQLIDVYKKPLGNEDRRSAPVKNIQTVEFERKGLINLILNFGTVKIKIGNEELTFNNVYQPSVVQGEIYSRYRAYLETTKKNDQQRFIEWIKAYDEIKKETGDPTHPANSDENG